MKHKQLGASLIEALIALLVMGLGMLAVVGIQGQLRASGEQAKQRGAAARLLTEEVERMRSAVALTRTPALPADAMAFDEVVSTTRSEATAQTTFTLTRSVQAAGPTALAVQLEVRWDDRQVDGPQAHSLVWHTLLPRPDALLQTSLAAGPVQGTALAQPNGLHPAIPQDAAWLNPEQSAFKPVEGGGLAWIFHHASGRITHTCSTAKPSSALTSNDVAACTPLPVRAWLLSGHVHTSLSQPPDAAHPKDATPAFGVQVLLSSTPHLTAPLCVVDTQRNAMKGIPAVDYHCAIVPRSPTGQDLKTYWSGQLQLTGLPLTAGGVRVCRYSDDADGDGSIGNAEHPASYQQVKGALVQQNHLLIRFEQNCPTQAPATASHQP